MDTSIDITTLNPVLSNINRIFENYYTAERIDWSKDNNLYYLIVKWPEITVKNEYNESTIIKDFYGKVTLDKEGKLIALNFIKETYSYEHIINGYIHSHLPRLYNINEAIKFKTPCLGKGPIKDTIGKLRAGEEFINDVTFESTWLLFCFELDKYVHTESVMGVPYIKLTNSEKIGTSKEYTVEFYCPEHSYKICTSKLETEFINYIIDKIDLNIVYNSGYYKINIPFEKFRARLTDLFNKFLSEDSNRLLYNRFVHISYKTVDRFYIDGICYKPNNDIRLDVESAIKNKIKFPLRFDDCTNFVFKHKLIILKIEECKLEGKKVLSLLTNEKCYEILTYLETILNIANNGKRIERNNTIIL